LSWASQVAAKPSPPSSTAVASSSTRGKRSCTTSVPCAEKDAEAGAILSAPLDSELNQFFYRKPKPVVEHGEYTLMFPPSRGKVMHYDNFLKIVAHVPTCHVIITASLRKRNERPTRVATLQAVVLPRQLLTLNYRPGFQFGQT